MHLHTMLLLIRALGHHLERAARIQLLHGLSIDLQVAEGCGIESVFRKSCAGEMDMV